MDDFPSKYLAASDIEDEHPTVTMRLVTHEEVGKDRERRPIVYFNEYDQGVVLNKTNATNITKLYGQETDDWIGKIVVLGTEMVTFNGETKPAIRIWPPKRKPGLKQVQARTSVNAPLDDGQRPFAPPADELEDEEIPF